MSAALNFVWRLIPLLLVLVFVGWVLWQWLKRSDEPVALIVRWVISLVTIVGVLGSAARARDEAGKIAALILGLFGGLVMVFVWRQKFCDFVGDLFAGLYTGGTQEVDPAPFYSIAQGKRKQGKFQEALEEIRGQLDRFPNDFQGWMLLAEVQADDLKDLASASETIEQVLAQEGHAPKNIAFALNRLADWHLKIAQDRDAARQALEKILERLPDTEQAQLAAQRLAHLTPEEMLAESQEPRRMLLPRGMENIGLLAETPDLKAPEEDPATAAARLVRHLEEFPLDGEAREKLAVIYAKHYRRLDLATDQLDQLVSCPNQPRKQVIHWLNLLADLQVEIAGDETLARQSLERIVQLYPNSAAAENAANRMSMLKRELRPKQANQAIKLGSYEENIGLKSTRDWRKPRG